MPRRVLVVSLMSLLASSASHAAGLGISERAEPGVRTLRFAEPLTSLFAVALSGGYGFTESVLGGTDRHHRLAGALAATVQPLEWLAFSLRFQTRYDRHDDVEPAGDDSFVAEPELGVAGMYQVADRLHLGLAIDVHLFHRGPGVDLLPSSVAASFAALASYRLIDSLVLGISAGYRLDRSDRAAESPDQLSAADRLALGLSAFDALPIAFGADWRIGDFEVMGELSWQPLVGAGAPSAAVWPLNVSFGARWSPVDSWIQVGLLATAALMSRPDLAAGEPLVAIEPRMTLLASLGVVPIFDEAAPPSPPPPPPAIVPSAPAQLRGRVTSQGAPVGGAQITVEAGGRTLTAASAPDGTFAFGAIDPGSVRLSIEREEHVPQNLELDLAPGAQKELAIELVPDLPDGELRGNVRSYQGRGIRTRLVIEPIGLEVETDEGGQFAVEIPPGTYEVVIAAPGFRAQRRQIEIQPRGVTLLNAELEAR